ncbi:alpha/beta fold hydrolase [Maricaulis sp.]|uniref:alpha/beta hydrolase family protein n=1 Tax=Maricaulis sp. TaxID=1486257 RepID=UPI00262D7ADA|nr:alpha/beta fold hydrolase [Maricaulis sp.]
MPNHPARTFLLAFLVLLITPIHAFARDESGDGDWLGALETPGGTLRLLVTVSTAEDGSQSAVLESLDQAPGQKIPVSTIVADDTMLEFEIAAIGARYRGRWNADHDRYEGEFFQGMALPLNFARPQPQTATLIEGLDGRWEAALDREGTILRLALNIETGTEGTQATLDSIDQAAYGIPVTALSRTGSTVQLQVPAAQVTYSAQLEADGSQLTGSWTRPGFPDVELVFTRVSSEVVDAYRPQTPQAPYPYTIEEVRIENPAAAGVTLAGTLTLPHGDGPHPAVILISGSGPQDRDESVWEHKPFAVLADHLSRNGIAVLRYDDRGFAESTGDFASATSRDFASDAEAALSWLRQQPGIDATSTGVIGHSEGGLIAPMLAQTPNAPDFMVLLAGPGTSGREIILEQTELMARAGGQAEADINAAVATLSRVTAELLDAENGADARARLDDLITDDDLTALGVPTTQRHVLLSQMGRDWYVEFLRHDPLTYLQTVEQPVLAVIGSLDLQVPAGSNLAGLREGLAGNPDATILELEGLNHMFQPAETGALAEYALIETTFDPAALALVSDWINQHFAD